ncbi:MAG: hypothetical protein H0Z35_09045 [Thermoanaerobacteraceae bacterium]|nr:hypothetical protein [Thermoanaerobacteraceae bacterium]
MEELLKDILAELKAIREHFTSNSANTSVVLNIKTVSLSTEELVEKVSRELVKNLRITKPIWSEGKDVAGSGLEL